MGWFSDKPEKRYLKSGDHIYVYRAGTIYSHHGIYMGDDKVVHFTVPRKASKAAKGSCNVCELMDFAERTSGVTISCLDCFLNGGELYRYSYGVSKVYYGTVYACRLRGGTCNTAESGPAGVVVERAQHLLETNGFGEYHVFYNNCEDFATFCKTAAEMGWQVDNLVSPLSLVPFSADLVIETMTRAVDQLSIDAI